MQQKSKNRKLIISLVIGIPLLLITILVVWVYFAFSFPYRDAKQKLISENTQIGISGTLSNQTYSRGDPVDGSPTITETYSFSSILVSQEASLISTALTNAGYYVIDHSPYSISGDKSKYEVNVGLLPYANSNSSIGAQTALDSSKTISSITVNLSYLPGLTCPPNGGRC